MKRRSFLLSASALALASPATFSDDGNAAAKPVVIGWKLDDISSLDPAEAFERASTEICRNIYNTLLVYDPNDTSVLKGLAAESWTSDARGQRYEFKLRPGMRFHSGRTVTANDFVYSITRAIMMNRASAFILNDLGINQTNVTQCVRALDPATIVLDLPEQRAQRLVLCSLTTVVAGIVDSEEVKAHVVNNDYGNQWMRSHSAGSGAFQLQVWQPSRAVVLKRFDAYWRGPAKAPRILLRHLPEPATQQLLLQKGDIDIARNLNSTQVRALGAQPSLRVQSAKTFRLIYLGLNSAYAPFSKPAVVEAMKYLIDYEGIVQSILNGFAVTRQSFVPNGIPWAVPDVLYKLDVERARRLLSEAGYPKGFEVTIDVRSSSPDIDIAQTLQATFGRAGVKLNIVPGDYKQMQTTYRARRHQMVMASWGADYPDPHSMAGTFASNPDNSDGAQQRTVAWRASWAIPEMTRLAASAAREHDAAKRQEIYKRLQIEHMKAGPIIQMFQEQQVIVRRGNVDGLLLAPSSYPDNYIGLLKT